MFMLIGLNVEGELKMKLTFRTKLFLCFVVIILFTSITIALITYNNVYVSFKKDLSSDTHAQMVHVDGEFSNMFMQIKENNRFLATIGDITKADRSVLALFNMSGSQGEKKYSKSIPGIEGKIYSYLEKYGTTHPDTAYAYLGTKWGGYIQWPDGLTIDKYDPRVRSWYRNAMANPDKVVISSPYTSSDEAKMHIVSVSSAVKDNKGNIIGVIGLDVSLARLSDIIRNIKFGNTGYAFLFMKDGTILAHPNTSLDFKNIKQLSVLSNKSDKMRNTLEYSFKDYRKLLTGGNQTFETIINGIPMIVNVYVSPYTGWRMACIMRKSELQSRVNKIGYLIIFATVCVLLFALALTAFVTRKITKPIEELTPLMNAAGNGDLTVRADIHTKDEFGELSNSFNLMIGKLGSAYDELVAVYEELSATEEELRTQYKELQDKEEALRNSDERYRLAVEGANDAIWQWDLATDKFLASDKLDEITGYRLQDTINFTELLQIVVHPDDLVTARTDLHNHLSNITSIYKSEYRIRISDGSYVWVLSRGKALRDLDNRAIKLAGSITDITERKLSEEKIRFMAFYDPLTKLSNRTFFMNKLNEQLELANRNKTEGAVFFIDLDNFKNINDTMGHDYGDKLIVYLAKQLEDMVGENDTICRLGGDEFIVLYPNIKTIDAVVYAKNLLSMFKNIFQIDNKQMYITASIGMALYPKDGKDAGSILKNADAAMYKAKELGKNRFALYDEEMSLELDKKTSIERILRTCIDKNELSIHYQPQYDAQKGEICGFEALLRLNSLELGFISPAEFIPIAEKSGYITQLDLWVLNEVCKQSVKWINEGHQLKKVSINISSVDINQPDFLDNVRAIFDNTKMKPCTVEFEITETVLMQSFEANIRILDKLVDMGVKIALDDFGTGYSSLNYLRKIPISTLKIDKSFIDNITTDIKEEAIIHNIIQMAHSMNLKVIAEGVETKQQLSILQGRDCDYIQGYYFSKPLPNHEFEKLLDFELK